MRAVLLAFSVSVLATVAIANPLSRQKRFAVGGFSAAGAPFGGAFAGTGFGPVGFYPFFGPGFPFSAVPMPMFPPIQIPVFKNWYEGENVCKEEKVMNSQLPGDVIPAGWDDDMPNVSTDFNHEQETCKGSDKKYVCVKRIMGNNGETKIKATKYECCHGFVRDPRGNPGCVESSGGSQQSNGRLTSNDPTYYIYSGNSGSSSSISRSSSNLDKVPIQ